MDKTLSSMAMKILEEMGWDFVPTGPNEWEWIKFNREGELIARQGSEHWTRDVMRAEEIDALRA